MSRRYFGSGTSVRDRTSAFRIAVAAARGSASRTVASPDAASASTSSAAAAPSRSARHALLDEPVPSSLSARASPAPGAAPGKRRGEFAERAQLIFLDVARTSEKLGNLAQRVFRHPLTFAPADLCMLFSWQWCSGAICLTIVPLRSHS